MSTEKRSPEPFVSSDFLQSANHGYLTVAFDPLAGYIYIHVVPQALVQLYIYQTRKREPIEVVFLRGMVLIQADQGNPIFDGFPYVVVSKLSAV